MTAILCGRRENSTSSLWLALFVRLTEMAGLWMQKHAEVYSMLRKQEQFVPCRLNSRRLCSSHRTGTFDRALARLLSGIQLLFSIYMARAAMSRSWISASETPPVGVHCVGFFCPADFSRMSFKLLSYCIISYRISLQRWLLLFFNVARSNISESADR